MADWKKLLEEAAAKAERDSAEQKIQAITHVMSALYDKAAAYTNLITVAGYAGFFAVWGTMKESMTRNEMLVAALAVTFSLIVFVAWEVLKMAITSSSLHGFSTALKSPHSKIDAALATAQQAEEKQNIRIHRFWRVVLFLTIAPGLLGGGTLIYSFVRQLMSLD